MEFRLELFYNVCSGRHLDRETAVDLRRPSRTEPLRGST